MPFDSEGPQLTLNLGDDFFDHLDADVPTDNPPAGTSQEDSGNHNPEGA